MFKKLTSLLPKRTTLEAKLEVDHLELSSDQLIVGFALKWINKTAEPLEIREVSIHLSQKDKSGPFAHLNYNGRFVRIPFQKAVTQIAGANSFYLDGRGTVTENLRFMTREIADLKDGIYVAELYTMVPAGTYQHSFEIKVTPDLKHRIGQQTNAYQSPPAASSAFTRALRIGATASR